MSILNGIFGTGRKKLEGRTFFKVEIKKKRKIILDCSDHEDPIERGPYV